MSCDIYPVLSDIVGICCHCDDPSYFINHKTCILQVRQTAVLQLLVSGQVMIAQNLTNAV